MNTVVHEVVGNGKAVLLGLLLGNVMFVLSLISGYWLVNR